MDKTIELPPDRIVVDPSLQPREDGLDAQHVAALQDNPDAWPPVAVVEDGGFKLVDGFHRYAAAQNMGLQTVPVKVVEMPTDGDLRSLAFALNAVHGRPLTLADRRAEAERVLRTDATVSNLDVARRTALSPTTVAAIREQLETAEEIVATAQRVSRSGVVYAPPVARQRGELPPDKESLGALFSSQERREQRRLARYFDRLAIALDDQFALKGWERPEDASLACRAVFGDEKAAQLAESLGPPARNVLDVAIDLGYEDTLA